jgi:SAM-dependent methyltransferase
MPGSNEVKNEVKKVYGGIAISNCTGSSCNRIYESPISGLPIEDYSKALGYTAEDLSEVKEHANLGLGCGNPTAIASLKEGETVIDLGSGGGFDAFLAAKKVGPSGRVIGIDMTQEMIDLATKNAQKRAATNVEFKLGEIENMPVDDNTADVIISNCVINLAADKQKVFKEASRVLKSGGRFAVSDIVATSKLPESTKNDLDKYTGCIGGALEIDVLKSMMESAGFINCQINVKEDSRSYIATWAPETKIEDYVASADIFGIKD